LYQAVGEELSFFLEGKEFHKVAIPNNAMSSMFDKDCWQLRMIPVVF